MHEKIKKIMTI